jgi:membrane glycosyltransferase
MDSLTLPAAEAPPAGASFSLGASMPGFAPLAMPAQSFRRFSRKDRRAWVNPRLAATPILARLAVFGGAIALTAYGAFQMYKVVGVSTTTLYI